MYLFVDLFRAWNWILDKPEILEACKGTTLDPNLGPTTPNPSWSSPSGRDFGLPRIFIGTLGGGVGFKAYLRKCSPEPPSPLPPKGPYDILKCEKPEGCHPPSLVAILFAPAGGKRRSTKTLNPTHLKRTWGDEPASLASALASAWALPRRCRGVGCATPPAVGGFPLKRSIGAAIRVLGLGYSLY